MKLAKMTAALAVIMMMTVVAAPTVSAGDSVDLTATVLEPKPEIAIELNLTAMSFGSLYPGNTSDPQDLKVTNIGLKTVDVTAEASDDQGQEALFVPGLLIDSASWTEYESTLAEDESDDTQLALHVPDEYASRGDVSGGAIFWAEEHVAGPTVLYDGTVELTAGGTFDFVAMDGTSYTGLTIDNDMGALYTTGIAFEASAEWYPNWFIESIGGIANEPFADGSHFWSIFINDQPADMGLHDNPVEDGDNVKFFYLTFDPDTYEFLVDEALYVVDIDVVMNVIGPVADFSASQTSGDAPLIVHFYDLSTYAPTSWSWDFGDGATSAEQAPGHTYSEAGVYTVSLAVSNSAGSDEVIKADYIVVNEPVIAPVADFSADVTSGDAPLTVQFTDLSTNGPTSWSWDFGDGTTSTEQSPSHTYAAGTYTVTLTASNSAGSDDEVKTGYIIVNELASPVTDFNYTSDGGAVTITDYTGPGGDVIIPGAIGGLPVIRIGDHAFQDCTALTSVTIPDNVTSIRYNAFEGCTNLTSVSIGSGVTSISNSAFYGCTALVSINIPDSVISIGSSVFERCAALTSITIGIGVTSIGSYAFSYCSALTSITIGNGVTSIGKYAFRGCTALTSMVFMGNAPTVGSNWANGCTNLVVYFHAGATGFTTPTWQGVPCQQL